MTSIISVRSQYRPECLMHPFMAMIVVLTAKTCWTLRLGGNGNLAVICYGL
jgi:hypothetical protein